MEKIVRVALIGFGGMGQAYAQMIFNKMVSGMVLVGVCCRNEAGQGLLKEKFPGVAIYPDLENMKAHAADYDAAIIVTPHITHVPIATELVKLGKHILLDKPAGISAGEVEGLKRLCEETGVSFAMMFNNRRLPAFREAKRMLEMGALGTLHRAVWVCNSWYRSPAYHRSAGWRSSWNGECGGLLINQNVHYLDMWQWLFGMPQKLYCDMAFGRYNDFSVDDAVDIRFTYENGFHGTMISASGEAPGVNRLEIWGSKGRLMVEDGQKLFFDENAVSTEVFAQANQEKFASIPHTLREISLETGGIPYVEIFENFARHLLCGDILYADGADGVKTTALTNAAYVSGWEERRVTVPVAEHRFRNGLKKRQEEESL